jgi:hypothetical protein
LDLSGAGAVGDFCATTAAAVAAPPAVTAKRKFLRDFLDTASDIPASFSLAYRRRYLL